MPREWKQREVEELEGLLDEYPLVGIISMHKLPAPQLQGIRKDLHGDAKIRMSRKTLMKIALDEVERDNIKEIERFLRGECAFIFTEMNPFQLNKYLRKNKSSAPAKAGDTAPRDIDVSEGNTGIDPGPAIGKLQNAGLPTSVEEGKIYIQEDTVVVEEGEEISEEVAQALGMLEMEPMEIGLNLQGVWEDGVIFEPEELEIDIEKYRGDIESAHARAVNLSVDSGYVTEETAPLVLSRAWEEARNLAINAEILEEEIVEDIIKKAYTEGKNIQSRIEEVS